MAVINTGLVLKGARSEFFNGLNSAPTYYQDLCTRIPSTIDVERYRWLGSNAMMREWVGPRQAAPLYPEAYDVTNLKYEATMEVDRTELEDDQTAQIGIRARGLGIVAGTHKDKLLASLLISNASSTFAYDSTSVYYFSATHSCRKTAASLTNLYTTNVDPLLVTTAEFKAAIMGCIGVMRTLLNDQGEPIYIGPGGFKIVVPPLYEYPAREAVQASILATTSNVIQGIGDVIVNPWLTAPGGTGLWYLLYTGGPIKPFIFQDREPLEFVALEGNSEHGFKNDKYLYGVRARYAIANGEWRYAVQHTFT